MLSASQFDRSEKQQPVATYNHRCFQTQEGAYFYLFLVLQASSWRYALQLAAAIEGGASHGL